MGHTRTQLAPAGAAPAGGRVTFPASANAPVRPKPTAKSLVWYDPAAGKFLPTRSEMEARAEAAEARADAIAAELAALKAHVEKTRYE